MQAGGRVGAGLPWRRLRLAGIVLSLLLNWVLYQEEQQWLEAQFQLDAKDRADAIQRAVADRLGTVRTVSAFFAGPGLVNARNSTRSRSRSSITTKASESYNGCNVSRGHSGPAHEQAIRETGLADYQINQRNARGIPVAAGKRDEYYPSVFIEPEKDSDIILDSISGCQFGILFCLSEGDGRRCAYGRRGAAAGRTERRQ